MGGDDEDDDFREPMKCSKREDLVMVVKFLFLLDAWTSFLLGNCFCSAPYVYLLLTFIFVLGLFGFWKIILVTTFLCSQLNICDMTLYDEVRLYVMK